jgi:hypothetical protein
MLCDVKIKRDKILKGLTISNLDSPRNWAEQIKKLKSSFHHMKHYAIAVLYIIEQQSLQFAQIPWKIRPY